MISPRRQLATCPAMSLPSLGIEIRVPLVVGMALRAMRLQGVLTLCPTVGATADVLFGGNDLHVLGILTERVPAKMVDSQAGRNRPTEPLVNPAVSPNDFARCVMKPAVSSLSVACPLPARTEIGPMYGNRPIQNTLRPEAIYGRHPPHGYKCDQWVTMSQPAEIVSSAPSSAPRPLVAIMNLAQHVIVIIAQFATSLVAESQR